MRTRFLLALSLCLWMSGVVLFPLVADAQAAKPCTCFCTSANGVVSEGKGKVAQAACEAACTNKKQKVAVCAPTLAEYPSTNRLCFTKKQCDTAQSGKAGELDVKHQPPECPTGMHYCYPLAKKSEVKLNIEIPGLSSVGDLAVYVDALYKWMLGVGVTIAIVMVMIGGFQYVLSAGGVKAGEGKQRISSAIIGLLMLFSIALIVGVINPELLKMKVPRLSLIRTLEITQGESCEDIEKENNITKEDGSPIAWADKKCGTIGVVGASKDPNKDTVTGTTCQYKGCEGQGAKSSAPLAQLCVGVGEKAKCLRCGQIVENNQFGIKPSHGVCDMFTQHYKKNFDGILDKEPLINRCIWSKDENINSSYGIDKVNATGSCAFTQLYCAKITSCGMIEDVVVWNDIFSTKLENVNTEPDGSNSLQCSLTQIAGGCADTSMRSICKENLCKFKTGCDAQPESGECDPPLVPMISH